MSGSSGGMGGAPGWPQDPDQVLNESMGDFDGTIAGEREVLAKSGGSAKSAGRREQADSDSVKDAGMGQGGMAGLPGSESASGGAAGAAGGAAGGQSGDTTGDQPAGSQGSQAGGGSGSTSTERSGDNNASGRDGANVANIPDDIPIDGSGDDRVAEQIREMAMQEEDPALREKYWEEYRKHTGIR